MSTGSAPSSTADATPAAPSNLLFTFYSYKGGVGRSMALANIAALLATWGKRVLMVDMDLEAPGLERYFIPGASADEAGKRRIRLSSSRAATPGMLDLILANASRSPLDWRKCVIRVQLPDSRQSLAMITAGQDTLEYAERLQELDWAEQFEHNALGEYLNKLREEWLADYDVVLVDSRTGISDIGGICTIILPDVLVLLFTTNEQSLGGVAEVMRRAREVQDTLPDERGRLIALPVCARDESQSEYTRAQEWRARIADDMKEFFEDWLVRDTTPRDVLQKLYIPYVAYWSFGERLPVVEKPEELSDPRTLGASYARLARLIENQLDWRVLAEQVDPHELAQAKAIAEKATAEAEQARGQADEAERARQRAKEQAENAERERRQLELIQATLKKSGAASKLIAIASVVGLFAMGLGGGWYINRVQTDSFAAQADLREQIKALSAQLSASKPERQDSNMGGASKGDRTKRDSVPSTPNAERLLSIAEKVGDPFASFALAREMRGESEPKDGAERLRKLLGGDALPLARIPGKFRTCDFSADGEFCLVVDEQGVARLWSVEGEKWTRWQAGDVRRAEISSSGDIIATLAEDRTVRVWSVSSTDEILRVSVERGTFRLDAPGAQLLVGGEKPSAWRLRGVKPTQLSFSKEIAFQTGGYVARTDRLYTISKEDQYQLRTWTVDGRKDLVSLRDEIASEQEPSVSADGHRAFVLSRDGSGAVVELAGGGKRISTGKVAGKLTRAVLNENGTLLALVTTGKSAGYELNLFDVNAGRMILAAQPVRGANAYITRQVTLTGDFRNSVADMRERATDLFDPRGRIEALSDLNPIRLALPGKSPVGALLDRAGSVHAFQIADWRTFADLDGGRGDAKSIAAAEESLEVAVLGANAVRILRLDRSPSLASMEWKDLLNYADHHQTVCLSAAERMQYLGESEEIARQRAAECAQSLGAESQPTKPAATSQPERPAAKLRPATSPAEKP
jgi:cellulose biosynthesis protein BcsQ